MAQLFFLVRNSKNLGIARATALFLGFLRRKKNKSEPVEPPGRMGRLFVSYSLNDIDKEKRRGLLELKGKRKIIRRIFGKGNKKVARKSDVKRYG